MTFRKHTVLDEYDDEKEPVAIAIEITPSTSVVASKSLICPNCTAIREYVPRPHESESIECTFCGVRSIRERWVEKSEIDGEKHDEIIQSGVGEDVRERPIRGSTEDSADAAHRDVERITRPSRESDQEARDGLDGRVAIERDERESGEDGTADTRRSGQALSRDAAANHVPLDVESDERESGEELPHRGASENGSVSASAANPAVLDEKTIDPSYQADLGEQYAKDGRRLLVNKGFEMTTDITKRVLDVSGAFGVGVDDAKTFTIFDDLGLRIAPGDVVYITGDSGSGKSTLLRYLGETLPTRPEFAPVLRGEEITIDATKTLIDSLGRDTDDAINILTHVGLNDAFIFLRKFGELSDGQKYRYRLARAIDASAKTLLFDEFCSVLDRTTARVVAYLLQKITRRKGITLAVATSHDDLLDDLNPTIFVRKRFGSKAKVVYAENSTHSCSLAKRVRIEEGTLDDYEVLKEFHYRAAAPPFSRKIYKMILDDETIGVIVYTTTIFMLANRNIAVPKLRDLYKESQASYMAYLNANFLRISRVVVHPRVRGIGLAVKLVRDTIPLVKKRYVETIASMARFNPFFEHAGMTRYDRPDGGTVALTTDWEECLVELRALGCDTEYIRSKQKNLEWLKTLDETKLASVKKLLKSYYSMAFGERLSKVTDLDGLAESLREVPAPMAYYCFTNEAISEVASQEYLKESYEKGDDTSEES